MKEVDIKKKIKEIFRDIFPELKKEKFNFNKRQEEFNDWDSFSHMKLASKIEDEFNIELEIEKIIDIDSPNGFVKILIKKLNNK